MRFIIPADISQLFEPDEGDNSMRCNDDIDRDENEIREIMADVTHELTSSTSLHLTESKEDFDNLCISVRGLGKTTPEQKAKLIEAMVPNLIDLASCVPHMVDAPDFINSSDDAQSHCDAISIFVYFISCVHSHLMDDLKRPQDEAASSKQRTQNGRGSRKQAVVMDDTAVRQALESMLEISHANVASLFETDASLQRAMSCCLKVAFTTFELPGMSPRHALYPHCIDLLAVCCAKYRLHEHAAPTLLNIVRSSDKLVEVPAAVAEAAEKKFGNRQLVVPLLGEFCKTAPHEFSEDIKESSIIVKRQAQFLSHLAEKAPKSFCQQVALLLPYLGSGAQTIRGEMLTCVQHLIMWLCNQGSRRIVASADAEDAEDNTDGPSAATQRIVTKQHLYEILCERFCDKSAFNRLRVCKIWRELVDLGSGSSVPYVHIGLTKQLLPELAVERLDDNSGSVVKHAVMLLSSLLINNPFTNGNDTVFFLDLDAYKATLQLTEKKLEELQAESDARENPQPAEAAAEGSEGNIKEEDGMEVDCDEEGEDGSAPVTPARARSGPSVPMTPNTAGKTQARTPSLGIQIDRQRATIATLVAAIEFTEVFLKAMPKLKQLLTTQSADVVKEVIKLISLCKVLRIPGGAETLRAMWGLVFSTDEDVRLAVVDAWKDMYFTRSEQETYEAVAHSLIVQLDGCTDGDIQAATMIIQSLAHQKEFNIRLFNEIMKAVDRLHASAVETHAQLGKAKEEDMRLLRAAFLLVSMIAKAHPEWLCLAWELRLLLKVGFCAKLNDAWLVRYACVTIERLAPDLRSAEGLPELKNNPARKHSWRMLIKAALTGLTKVLLASRLAERNWYSAAQAAIQAIFQLHPKPNNFMAKILQTMEASVRQPRVSSVALSRFMFVMSHACLSLLAFIDTLTRRVKKLRMQQAQDAAEGAASMEGGGANNDIEAELGVGLATVDLELDVLKETIESEMLDSKYLLGGHAKLLSTFLTDNYKNGTLVFLHPELVQAACLALTKLMLIDRQYCEDNVSLLFSMLTKEDAGTNLRCNILIALGDLNVRFPNILEPWTEKMYEPLSGNNLEVKKTCVTVLTFLLLNDMIKVKGHIYKLALLLRDPNPDVQILASRFWNELAKKAHHGQNPIFNLLLDIISNLSSIHTLSSDDFDHILTFLLDKVDKDKHVDHLKERLCVRLEAIHDDAHQWHKLMVCLTKLKYTEKGTKRVMELLRHYKHTLVDQIMLGEFKKLSDKLRKNSEKKPELQQMADEYDKEVDAIVKALGVEDEAEEEGGNADHEENAGKGSRPGPQEVRVKDEDVPDDPPAPGRRTNHGRRAASRAAASKKVANPRSTRRSTPVPVAMPSDDESQDTATSASEEDVSEDEASNVQQEQSKVGGQRRKNSRGSKQVEQLSGRVQQLSLKPTRTRQQPVHVAEPQQDSDEEMEE